LGGGEFPSSIFTRFENNLSIATDPKNVHPR